MEASNAMLPHAAIKVDIGTSFLADRTVIFPFAHLFFHCNHILISYFFAVDCGLMRGHSLCLVSDEITWQVFDAHMLQGNNFTFTPSTIIIIGYMNVFSKAVTQLQNVKWHGTY